MFKTAPFCFGGFFYSMISKPLIKIIFWDDSALYFTRTFAAFQRTSFNMSLKGVKLLCPGFLKAEYIHIAFLDFFRNGERLFNQIGFGRYVRLALALNFQIFFHIFGNRFFQRRGNADQFACSAPSRTRNTSA